MKELPHHYSTSAHNLREDDTVTISSPGLGDFSSAGPAEFDGPGNLWSPETMLTAAVGDCFILTFRAVAAASKLDWSEISCSVEGILDKVERTMRFTEFRLRATLRLPEGADEERAQRVLEKSERACIIRNSIVADVHATFEIEMV